MSKVQTNIFQAVLSSIGFVLLLVAFVLSFFEKGFGSSLWVVAIIYGFMLFGVLAVFYANKRDFGVIHSNRFLIFLFIAYLFWLWIGPYFSDFFDLSRLTAWVLMLTPVSFFITLVIDIDDIKKKILAVTYLSLGFILFAWGILHFVVTKTRSSGPFLDANVYAGILLMFLLPVLVFVCIVEKNSKKKKSLYEYLCIYILFGLLAFFAADSRSALLAFIVVGTLLLCKIFKEYRLTFAKRMIALIVLVCSSFLAIDLYHSANDKRGFSNFEQDEAVQIRLEIWKSSYEMYKLNPVHGVGFGRFKAFYKRHRSKVDSVSSGDYAHNDYLQYLVEGGLIQLGFFIILAGFIIKTYFELFFRKVAATQKYKNISLFALLNIVCVYFIQANANFIFYMAPCAIIIGVILGYLSKIKSLADLEFRLSKGKWFLLISLGVLSTLSLFIDTYIQDNFYVTPGELEQKQAMRLFSSSEILTKIRPNSLALWRYQFLYSLNQVTDKDAFSNFVDTHKLLDRVLGQNRNDSHTLFALARFSEIHPDKYMQLAEHYADSKFYEDPETLYRRTLIDDPALVLSYYRLRNIYRAMGENQKAYQLWKNKLYSRFEFGEINVFSQLKITEILLNDAIELGDDIYVNEYANLLLGVAPCNKVALKVVNKSAGEECADGPIFRF